MIKSSAARGFIRSWLAKTSSTIFLGATTKNLRFLGQLRHTRAKVQPGMMYLYLTSHANSDTTLIGIYTRQSLGQSAL